MNTDGDVNSDGDANFEDEENTVQDAVMDGSLDPDVERHVVECIDAVVQRSCEELQGSDGTVWQVESLPDGRRQAVNVMRAAGGLSAIGRRHCGETALSNWLPFFDDPIINKIVGYTNEKARSMDVNFVTTGEEVTTFIGVSILIGVYKGRSEPVRAMWSQSEGRKCISQFMSRNRFELMTKYLRFDKTSTRQNRRQETKFAPMGDVYDMWEERLSRPFIPYEYVTVDETLVPFRGRCSFKQYMPSKPAKYGLKFWCLCDAKTGYCLHMQPYLGADNGAGRTTGLGQKVVLNLTKGTDVGRTVVTDNFFTSLELLRNLRKRNLGLIETVRKNRRELPKEFVSKKSVAGTSLFGFHEDATLVSYAPKRNKRVVLLSSEHNRSDIDVQTGKPEIILAYNKAKGGVDHLDQMCGAYTTRKRTQRWPKCVFQHMVDVSAFNAFILWGERTGKQNTKRRQFLKMLGAELCGGGVDEHGNILLKVAEPVAAAVLGVPVVPAVASGRLRCRKCKTCKTLQRCQTCGDPLCINCASYTCKNC